MLIAIFVLQIISISMIGWLCKLVGDLLGELVEILEKDEIVKADALRTRGRK